MERELLAALVLAIFLTSIMSPVAAGADRVGPDPCACPVPAPGGPTIPVEATTVTAGLDRPPSAPPPIGIPELDRLRIDASFTTHLATAEDVARMVETQGVHDPRVDHASGVDGHRSGLAPPTLEEYEAMVGSLLLVDDVSLAVGTPLPTSVDLSDSPYFPAIGNQETQNSCTAWAVGYYTNGFLQARDNNWTEASQGTNRSQLLSPAWVYNLLNGGSNSYTSIASAIDLISSLGQPAWSTMPYVTSDPESWGSERAWREAPLHRVHDLPMVATCYNPDVIKTWLAQGYVVPSSVPMYNFRGLGSGDPVISSAEFDPRPADHSVAIVGYNDTMEADGDVGAFKCANSWGPQWGTSWSGNGSFWITYDALRETYVSAHLVRDKEDYQPSLLASFNHSTPDGAYLITSILVDCEGTVNKVPGWNWNPAAAPDRLLIDVTELVQWAGVGSFQLRAFAWQTPAPTITSFELERYDGDYIPGSPSAVVSSVEVPRRATCTVNVTWPDVHVNASSPEDGTWHRENVTVTGQASPNVSVALWDEGFEGTGGIHWYVQDANPASGLDTWGRSGSTTHGGCTAMWCAGSDNGAALFDDMDYGAAFGTSWGASSTGVDRSPWAKVSSGYRGSSQYDRIAVVTSEGGGNVVEWLVSATPISCSNFDNLSLRFYLDYVAGSGDGYGRVMWANGSTYPSWTLLDEFTQDTLGFMEYDVSFLDGEARAYLAFVYHGTDDRYMAIDDVTLVGVKTGYDANMRAQLDGYLQDLTSHDRVTLEFSYLLESKAGRDYLEVLYESRTTHLWDSLWARSGLEGGWTDVTLDVPKDVYRIRFEFRSTSSTSYEGGFLDDIRLLVTSDLDNVTLAVDGAEPQAVEGTTDWSWDWTTTGVPSGLHELTIRGNYGPYHALDLLHVGLDRVPPLFGTDASPDIAETDMMYTFSIPVFDDLGVARVWVEYWYGDEAPETRNLTLSGGSTWETYIIVNATLEDLHFSFGCTDQAGNLNRTAVRTVDVVDINGPVIVNDGTSHTATTGDPHEFTATVGDNVGVRGARVWYAFGDTEPVVTGMEVVSVWESGNVLLSLWIDIPSDFVGYMRYHLTVEDLYGTVLDGPLMRVHVVDDDIPEIVEDGTPDRAHMGEPFDFLVTVADNVGVASVSLEYALWNPLVRAQMTPGEVEGQYTHSIGIPEESAERMSYRFQVVDLSGNVLNGTEREVAVIDGLPPVITVLLDTGQPAMKGHDLVVAVSVEDNIGVEGVFCEYWTSASDRWNVSMSGDNGHEATISVPRGAEGNLHLVFSARDAAGNWASMAEQVVELVNAAPLVDEELTWRVMEESDATLDLTDRITDPNDDLQDLTLSCDSEAFTVVGLKLSVRFDQWVPGHFINVTVSDGEDDAKCRITVTVIGVNDAPILTSVSPENGTRFRQGEVIVFRANVTDEDGDELTVTWLSGGVALGTGTVLEYKGLKPGTHGVRVSVSDGERSVTDDFTIVVKKREESDSPGLGSVFTLMAVMVAVVIALMMARRPPVEAPATTAREDVEADDE